MKSKILRKLKKQIIRGKYLLSVGVLMMNAVSVLTQVPAVSATPTFSDYPISSTYKKPGAMTVAGGDLWYLESSTASAPVDSIGRMTTSGVTTDYAIGLPSGATSFTLNPKLITGSDGNVWFHGVVGSTTRLGKLDITTGAVTFYSTGGNYSLANFGAGPDGKIYFSYHSGTNSYLKSFDIATGAISLVRTYDNYSTIGNIITGPDGRLYVTNYQMKWIHAISVTGGTNDTFSTGSTGASNLASGPDGNLWFVRPDNKIVKMTTTGTLTEYDVSSSAVVNTATKLVAGPDGAVWFYNANTTNNPKIGRITTSGLVTTYAIPSITGTTHYEYGGPVVGPDGAIWVNYYIPNGVQKLVRLGY